MCLWKRKMPIWHLIQEWPHGLQQPFWLQCYSGWDDHQKQNILQTKHKDNHMQLNRNQKTFLVVGCEVWEVIKKLLQGDTFGSLMNAPTDSTLQVFNTCCPYCSGKTSGKTKWGYISCSFLRIQTWHLKLFCLDIPLSECLKYRPAMDSKWIWSFNS